MAFGNGIKKLKEKICDTKLETGDVVKVLAGGNEIPVTEHPIGGAGRWAVFIEKRTNGAIVRPILDDGTHGAKATVERVQSLDEAISKVAVDEYKKTRMDIVQKRRSGGIVG